MNIFFTDINPTIAARNLCTIHINSQIKESAQMLSTIIHERGLGEGYELYKPTHQNHPCVWWLRESDGNIQWLITHALAMGDYFYIGRRKEHKCTKILEDIAELFAHQGKDEILQPPYLAMPEELQKKYGVPVRQCKKSTQYIAVDFDNAVAAYREYYCTKKFNFPEGDSRNVFKWYTNKPNWYNSRSSKEFELLQ